MKTSNRFVVAFLIVVFVSGTALFATFDAHRTDVTQGTELSVADRAELSASVLDDRIGEQQDTVDLAASNPHLTEHGTEVQERSLEKFLESATFDDTWVLDADGEVRAAATDGDTDDRVGENQSGEPYVERALHYERYVSDPFLDESGEYVVVISAPLTTENGSVVGTLNGAYHLEETELFEPLTADDDRTAVTVEASNETLYSDADQFEETMTKSKTLESTDWTVTAHYDEAAVSDSIDQLAVFQAVSGVALLGSVIGFGIWIYRSKIRRIDRLLDRLGALERREYDAGPRLEGSPEWRQIDDALEELTEALSRREQMLLVLNRILRHNLRNTLNVISGRASSLEATLEGEDRESAAEIREAADELLTLAERARTTETLLEPVDEEVRIDVATLARERVDAFVAATGADGVTATAPERAAVACGEELTLVIDELLRNIAEHAGPDPTAELEVTTSDDRVFLRLSDDGDGMPDHEAAVINGDCRISQIHHTGGIGLWLADWIVGRYDGVLRVDSSQDGTVVTVELPCPDGMDQ